MKAIAKSYQSKLEAFNLALNGAKQNLLDAGRILCEMLDEDSDTFEHILESNRGVTLRFLESLERIGRGQLEPLLLTDPSPAAQRAVAQALPMEDQKQLTSGFVPVAVKDNGGVKVVQKQMSEITAQEAARVIGSGTIRTADEQIEMLKQADAAQAASKMRYAIKGDKIHFYTGADFTYSELLTLLTKIEPKAEDIEAAIAANQIK